VTFSSRFRDLDRTASRGVWILFLNAWPGYLFMSIVGLLAFVDGLATGNTRAIIAGPIFAFVTGGAAYLSYRSNPSRRRQDPP
jgi:hypothetical protein